jgi:PIN domain nuclease of toxin-antitoxin system
MDTYVIDTHAWVWQMFQPKKLGIGAARVLSAADRGEARIHIPAVVLAELLMIANKRRLENLTPEIIPRVVHAVRTHPAYSFSGLTPELVLASQAHVAVPEIFDRLVVTEARLRGVSLITRDPEIHAAGLVPIIWD